MSNKKNEEKYLGNKKVLSVNETGDTTPLGSKIYEVNLEDGSIEVVTEKILNYVVDTKECDLTELRRRRVEPVVKEMLVLLREANMKIGDLDYLLSLFTESINQNNNEASNKLWNVKDGGERTFLQIDKVLEDNGPKK